MLSKNFEQRIKSSKSIGDRNKSDKDKFYNKCFYNISSNIHNIIEHFQKKIVNAITSV